MPFIHIFAGLNVCIQVMTPMTLLSLFASSTTRRIEPESLTVGFQMILIGRSPDAFSRSTTALDCSATCARVSSP